MNAARAMDDARAGLTLAARNALANFVPTLTRDRYLALLRAVTGRQTFSYRVAP